MKYGKQKVSRNMEFMDKRWRESSGVEQNKL